MKRLLQFFAMAVIASGLFGWSGQEVAAQNAAQTTALAKLGRGQGRSLVPNTSGNGTEASDYTLIRPSGVTFDPSGNLYIADRDNDTVLEVNLQGIVSVVAGTGVQGFSGDGGPATSAMLDSPYGLATDASGNLYIADTHNQRIREVVNGTINTIAGTGTAGFSGDGGAATSAELDNPRAVAVDAGGNVWIADTDNQRIRKIVNGTIQTVAGNGVQGYSGDGGAALSASLDSPNGLAVDSALNYYIGDTNNQRVRMVSGSTGIITTLAGTGVKGYSADGAGGSTVLARPMGVAVDGSGKVYFADSDNNLIRTVAGGQVQTIGGNGQEGNNGNTGISTNAELDTPRALAVNGSSVDVADTNNQAIRTITSSGIDTVAGNPSSGNELLTLSGTPRVSYGTGALVATFSNGSNTATGTVNFYDGLGANANPLGAQPFAANTASLNTALLAAGIHYITAVYSGDSNNSAITSGTYVLTIAPVSATATANGVSLLYGQSIPSLTGTLSGVLAQDSGKVTATYSTTATSSSSPGNYPIAVTLSGSAASNYALTVSGSSGSVVIAQAPTNTALTVSSATPAFGAKEILTAIVTSTTSGTPTGAVNFYDGTTLLNTAPIPLSGSVASLSLTSLPVGSQQLSAVYSGDTNFLTSTSAAATATVASPDFTLTATTLTQNLLPGQSTNFQLAATPLNSTFVYPLTFTVTGLPAGVTATFSPSTIPVGAGATVVTMTLSASPQAWLHRPPVPYREYWKGTGAAVLALLLLPAAVSRRIRRVAGRFGQGTRMLLIFCALLFVGALAGCGAGGFFSHATGTNTITVTATSGPAVHTTSVTLTLQ